MSASASMPWGDFSADPRDPATASLRASDRDREVVLHLLADAYVDGRLTREEHDERVDAVSRSRTLAELPPAVADLVPQTADHGGATSSDDLHARALRTYEASRREALSGLLIITLTLSVVWFVSSGGGGFYWPIFVILAAGGNLLRILLNKRDLVAQEERRLERKARKRLGRPADT